MLGACPPPQELLAARARRVTAIRQRVIAAVLASFVLFWGAVAWDGSMGAETSSAAPRPDRRVDGHLDRVDATRTSDDRRSPENDDSRRRDHGPVMSEHFLLDHEPRRGPHHVARRDRRGRARAADGRPPAQQRRDLRVAHEALSLATLVALAVHALALLGDGYLEPEPRRRDDPVRQRLRARLDRPGSSPAGCSSCSGSRTTSRGADRPGALAQAASLHRARLGARDRPRARRGHRRRRRVVPRSRSAIVVLPAAALLVRRRALRAGGE